MRVAILFCLTMLFGLRAGAQTTALDFQKTDCAGVNHHLFAELDSGYVILMEFVMMSCQPCIVAAHGLEAIHAQFEATHPGKVRYYSMGFLNSISCTQMNNWKAANQLSNTMFSGSAQQVDYYGGMGMPTVVVLGGNAHHKVFYNHFGYSTQENAPIAAAISQAISESTTGTDDQAGLFSLLVAPNPFDASLMVSIPAQRSATHLVVTDLSGRTVIRNILPPGCAGTSLELSTQTLQPGFYLLGLYDGNQLIGYQKLVKS